MKPKRVRQWGVIDLLGLGIFILMLLTAVFFFLRRSVYINVVLRVAQGGALEVYGLPTWYVENLKPGIEQKDFLGRSVISLQKAYSYPSNVNERVSYLNLKLLTTYDKKSKTYSYEGVPILIGSYQNFRLNGILLRGVVYRIESSESKPEKKIFEVNGYLNPGLTLNQDPYTAETIADGIKNYLAERFKKGLVIEDGDRQPIVEVEEVKLKPAKRKFIYGNQLVETEDQERKRVELKLKISAEKRGDIFMFREDMPLIINGNIYLDFWDFGAMMTITDFKAI